MANTIDPTVFNGYLENIMKAVYGEEVRGSIHDAIQAMYNVVKDEAVTTTDVFDATTPSGSAADAKAIHEQAVLVRGSLEGASGSVINFNTITTTGAYRLIGDQTYTNSPLTTVVGWLLVFKSGTGGVNCIQIVYETGSSDKRAYSSYFRSYNANKDAWSSWQVGNYALDTTLTQEGQAADAKAVGDMIAELKYSPIEITNLNYNFTTEDGLIVSNDPRYPENEKGARVEKGCVVINMNYQWTTNKTPVKVTIDGNEVSLNRNGTLSQLRITSDKTWTFKVKEEAVGSLLPYTDSKAATIRFLPRIFWGVAVDQADPNSAFLEGFRSSGSDVLDTLERTFTVTAAAGQYIWYAYPTSFGVAQFVNNGFKGGFTLVKTMRFTSKYNISDAYYVYRSVQPSLGNITIEVIQAS